MTDKLRGIDLISLIALLVLLAGTMQLGAGAWEVGVTVDEPTHVSRTQSWLTHGWYVPERWMIDGSPMEDEPRASPFIYGPGFSSLAHLANVIAGNESGGELSYTAEAHGVRHVVVAAFGLLAAGSVGVSTWALTRSRRFALWGAAALLSVPAWTGHSFFNVKDVPAAVGYTFVTTALLLTLTSESDEEFRWPKKVAISALLVAGTYVGAGTRLAFWAAIVASIAGFLMLDLGIRKLGRVERPRGARTVVLSAFGLGLAILALAYPKNAAAPASWLIRSLTDSAGYAGGPVLTAGQLVVDPWWYLPAWLFGSYPIVLMALAVLGVVCSGHFLSRRGSGRFPYRLRSDWIQNYSGIALVLLQALLLPVGATIIGATMYDGLRQHLYVVPAIAILSATGAHQLWRWSKRSNSKSSRSSTLVALLLCVGLLVPMVEQTLLFPYNYTYINPLMGAGGVNDRWETDYWFASAPEALSLVPPEVDLRCTDDTVRPGYLDRRISVDDCERNQFLPYQERRGSNAGAVPTDASEVWVMSWKRAGNQLPSYCQMVDQVSRWLRGETITMSFLMRCERAELTG